ncbi:hypothetical protein ACXR2T_02875 [Leucobacter sp. HY1910]
MGHTMQTILLAGVALSCGLTGCTQAIDTSAHATRLSAAQDSDVLAPPSERIYEATDIEISSAQSSPSIALPAAISPSGYFVVGDGVITDAWFETRFGGELGDHATASFQLTEPTVLRRVQSKDGSLTAVGTLTYGGVERPDTSVQFNVISLDDEGAELAVTVQAPVSVLAIDNEHTEVAARITFDVRD